MSALLLELSAAAGLADSLCRELGCERGELERRQFPDGESYVRIGSAVERRDVILLCSLDDPDAKVLPLLFVAEAARAQGARSVGLVAPYLAYMRQDKAFRSGEAVTSRIFASIISDRLDWLVTIDAHLHRHRDLGGIYSVPVVNASAVEAIGSWVRSEVEQPLIIGPDEESRQWVERIAKVAGARLAVLSKSRSGDFSVAVDDAGLAGLGSGTAVIVDDIASSASTLIETVNLLERHGYTSPVCVVVHPIFAGDSYDRLVEAGAGQIVSTNTIAHHSNAIDISGPLAEAVAKCVETTPRPRR